MTVASPRPRESCDAWSKYDVSIHRAFLSLMRINFDEEGLVRNLRLEDKASTIKSVSQCHRSVWSNGEKMTEQGGHSGISRRKGNSLPACPSGQDVLLKSF